MTHGQTDGRTVGRIYPLIEICGCISSCSPLLPPPPPSSENSPLLLLFIAMNFLSGRPSTLKIAKTLLFKKDGVVVVVVVVVVVLVLVLVLSSLFFVLYSLFFVLC